MKLRKRVITIGNYNGDVTVRRESKEVFSMYTVQNQINGTPIDSVSVMEAEVEEWVAKFEVRVEQNVKRQAAEAEAAPLYDRLVAVGFREEE